MARQAHALPGDEEQITESAVAVAGAEPVVAWSEVAELAPDALAVVDEDGLFLQLNAAAVALCARPADALLGMPAPFDLSEPFDPDAVGLLEDGTTERVCTWAPVAGSRREFAYRARRLDGAPSRSVVAFRDVTNERHRHRRIAAIARTSAKLVSEGSVTATLDALAAEVLRADALAGVQILTVDATGHGLQIMGSAGFRRWPDFFERLMECRERGAALKMLEALESQEPIVVPGRWSVIRNDPAWAPLREYLGELSWDWFASVPLMVRGRAAGVLNAFYAPGQIIGQRALEFLLAMADQAAVAVDYASLLENERDLARREERQRLARDLHDSIVQQVFSISMQAKTMGVLGSRADSVPADVVRRNAEEVGVLSRTVLADLRAMVHELRPPSSAALGLEEAVRALVESTTNRTGLRFSLSLGHGLDDLATDMAEDLYRIIAEAIHNVVKHAEASHITIRLAVRDTIVLATVADDGRGLEASRRGGERPESYGLTGMRERAERWGGSVRVQPRRGSGTSVRVVLPLPISMPRAPVPAPRGVRRGIDENRQEASEDPS